MFNHLGKLSDDETSKLKSDIAPACIRAADAIRNADILIIVTGAGFSADSGLPVYKDVAQMPAYIEKKLTYRDLSTPKWLVSDPPLAYGWWGSSFNSYRDTQPHEGYDIVRRWYSEHASRTRDSRVPALIDAALTALPPQQPVRGSAIKMELTKSTGPVPSTTATTSTATPVTSTTIPAAAAAAAEVKKYSGNFYCLTSNVDNHWHRCGFDEQLVWEIHGHMETWQCIKPCTRHTWTPPASFRFNVDPNTLVAAADAPPKVDGGTVGFRQNHPSCPNCGAGSRPAIMMFDDGYYVPDRVKERQWDNWLKSVKSVLAENPSLRVTMLEIGCGLNVPTLRFICEGIARDVGPQQATLIRVNPDFPTPLEKELTCIPIMTGGLAAVRAIDAVLHSSSTPMPMPTPVSSTATVASAPIAGAATATATV